MKRFQLLVVVSLITAAAIWVGYYKARHTSSAAVTALLPKNTLAFVHLPDFNRSRAEFRQTDLYQIWNEPSVRDFLQKPRTKIPTNERLESTLQECESLQMRDAFVALVSIESNAWKIVGGFRFSGDPDSAQKIVAKWKSKVLGEGPDLQQETIEYQSHPIETDSKGIVRLATVRDGEWFLFANDPELLKPVLDRVDGRVQDHDNVLAADDIFVAASRRMPSVYVALGFARIDQLVEKFIANNDSNESIEQMASLRQIRSLCGATSLDGGKIHDTMFVGMPKLLDAGDLTRASLPIATRDAFLYASGFLNLKQPLPLPASQNPIGWLSGLQKITDALASKGVTLEAWNSAFGPEVSWIGEWPTNAHWPSFFATLPVTDSTKAKNILSIVTTANEESITWKHQEKGGVHYFSTRSGGPLLSFSPTIGLSDQLLVAGADTGSVESAMNRAANANSGLASSKIFLTAERTVPSGRQAFTYFDPALLYTRLDATLRPILLMGAAFVPGVADTVDLNKLPAPDVITKHLGPIVMSQSYDRDGYVAESVGPITLGQTIVGFGGLGALAALVYQHQMPHQISALTGPATSSGVASPASASASPSSTPDDEP